MFQLPGTSRSIVVSTGIDFSDCAPVANSQILLMRRCKLGSEGSDSAVFASECADANGGARKQCEDS
ncbi:hypothetical protein ANANG_G00197000 [Anguilla anguilla]|uniref:Uncharacterized protein n=1 Tax=Anguilla anguilla TaxID=7936 RepID=A0A9D3RVP9_ANGAN|nr:hypothetical protein ANANG_G00197000 [Anguilla anguilla]